MYRCQVAITKIHAGVGSTPPSTASVSQEKLGVGPCVITICLASAQKIQGIHHGLGLLSNFCWRIRLHLCHRVASRISLWRKRAHAICLMRWRGQSAHITHASSSMCAQNAGASIRGQCVHPRGRAKARRGHSLSTRGWNEYSLAEGVPRCVN